MYPGLDSFDSSRAKTHDPFVKMLEDSRADIENRCSMLELICFVRYGKISHAAIRMMIK